jgi:CRISPR/Cas system-associated exonuclease Cas4 (RecB family)
MQVIRSSDIGNYLYCRRAWWYRQQGFASENQAELATGSELHRKHGRKVLAAMLLRVMGFLLLLLGLILLVAYCTARLI